MTDKLAPYGEPRNIKIVAKILGKAASGRIVGGKKIVSVERLSR